MVDLQRQLSSLTPQIRRVLELKLPMGKMVTKSDVRKLQRQVRLPDAAVSQLARDYSAGATVTELAKQFGIHRTTVMDHLRRQGVPKQGRRLSHEQIRQAKYMRNMGMSYEAIGRAFGVDGETIKRCSVFR